MKRITALMVGLTLTAGMAAQVCAASKLPMFYDTVVSNVEVEVTQAEVLQTVVDSALLEKESGKLYNQTAQMHTPTTPAATPATGMSVRDIIRRQAGY